MHFRIHPAAAVSSHIIMPKPLHYLQHISEMSSL
uniref:Uncharacterized protein n=1 Tax=Anguilla anguilla TaxID=7936 RepID=A0A0E9TLJ1_ANGAN